MQGDVLAQASCSACNRRGGDELCMCPCELAHYCGPTCQQAHWEVHKNDCTHGRKTQVPVTQCVNCHAVSSQNMWCPCGTVLYCSRECQRQHWDSEHFQECRTARSGGDFAMRDTRQAAKFGGKQQGNAGAGGGLGSRFLAVIDGVRSGNVQ